MNLTVKMDSFTVFSNSKMRFVYSTSALPLHFKGKIPVAEIFSNEIQYQETGLVSTCNIMN